MKFRTDFVTNSSSSSFTILITVTDKSGNAYRFFDDPYRWNPDNGGEIEFQENLWSLTANGVAQKINRDKKTYYVRTFRKDEKDRLEHLKGGEELTVARIPPESGGAASDLELRSIEGPIGRLPQEAAELVAPFMERDAIRLRAFICRVRPASKRGARARYAEFTVLLKAEVVSNDLELPFSSISELAQYLMNATSCGETNKLGAGKARFIRSITKNVPSLDDVATITVDRFLFEFGEGYDCYNFLYTTKEGDRNSNEFAFVREKVGYYEWNECLSLREHSELDLQSRTSDCYNEVFDLDRYDSAITGPEEEEIEQYIQRFIPKPKNDFVMESSVLVKYKGHDSAIIIPDEVMKIGDGAFSHFGSLKSVVIPNSVTAIGSHAFWNCSGLTKITLSEGLVSIGNGAFSGCSNLDEITLPNSVESVGSRAFCNCGAITIKASEAVMKFLREDEFVITNHALTKYNGPGGDVVVPDGVSAIGEQAFKGCGGLQSVILPDSVKSIGKNAFRECKNLTSVILPDGLVQIGPYAFFQCVNLTSINLPNSLTDIGQKAFAGCPELGDLSLS